MDLPKPFLDRMKQRLGSAFPAFLQSYERPPERGLRVNTLKLSETDFERISPFPLEKVPWEESGYYYRGDRAGGDVYHFAGLYYLQEPSAMCAAPLLRTEPGERVLDLCAAPGGKTSKLAAAMRGEGLLVANEISYSRAKILSQNVERMGIGNCAVLCAEPNAIERQFPAFFDKVLVDAPCSGEGMFKKEPNAIKEWSEENVAMCAARQRGILDSAANTLRAGGILVYSTCTFAEEEDEEQVEAFLARHPEFELIAEEKLLPHEVRGEGHYAAALRKREGERKGAKGYPIRTNASANAAFRDFAEEFFGKAPCGEITTLQDGRMYLVPPQTPDWNRLALLRLGVELGEWDGRVFKPSHALVMAYGAGAKRKLVLGRAEAERFLRGESLGTELINGWCAVCVGAFPLGLGKAVDGVVKNHLPKGLRMFRLSDG